MKIRLLLLFWVLFVIVFSRLSHATELVYVNPSMAVAGLEARFNDLSIKVPQGQMTINRSYGNSGWLVNPRWRPLDLGKVPAGSTAVRVDDPSCSSCNNSTVYVYGSPNRNELIFSGAIGKIYRDNFKYIYSHTETIDEDTQAVYYLGNNKSRKITFNGTTFIWSDRNGNWIEYNALGQAIAFGDHLGNDYQLNWQENSLTLIDTLERTLLTITYQDGNTANSNPLLQYRIPTQVEDYSGRTVEYQWDTDKGVMTSMKDVYGQTWAYGYEEDTDGNVVHTGVVSYSDLLTQIPTWRLSSITRPGEEQPYIQAHYSTQDTISSKQTVCGTQSINAFSVGSTVTDMRSNTNCVVRDINKKGKILSKISYGNGDFVDYGYQYYEGGKYLISKTYPDGSKKATLYDNNSRAILSTKNDIVIQIREVGEDREQSIDQTGRKIIDHFNEYDERIKREYPDGSYESWEYLPNSGFIKTYRNRGGILTRYEYDENIRLIKTIQAYGKPEAIITEYGDYTDTGLYQSMTLSGKTTDGQDTPAAATQYEYDSNGNIIKIIDAEGYETKYQDYNVLGQYQTMVDARGNSWTFTYDVAGNTLIETTPMGLQTRYTYDEVQNLMSIQHPGMTEEQLERFEYDARDKTIQRTNTLGHSIQYEFDTVNRKTTITDAEGNSSLTIRNKNDLGYRVIDAAGNIIEYIYGNSSGESTENNNAINRSLLTSIYYPTGRVELEYDANNQVIQETRKNKDSTTVISNVRYVYDIQGRVIDMVVGNEQTTSYVYDALGRKIKITDSLEHETRSVFNARGNVLQVTDAEDNITSYSYNLTGQRIQETRSTGDSQSWQYDASGNMIRHTDYNGRITTYEYDKDNRPIIKKRWGGQNPDNDNSQPEVVNYTYHATTGHFTGYSGTNSSVSYINDSEGQVLQQTVTLNKINGGTLTKTSQYTYNKNGQRQTLTTPEGQTTTYGYTPINQLDNVTFPDNTKIQSIGYNWLRTKGYTFPGGSKQFIETDDALRITGIESVDSANNTKFKSQLVYDQYSNIIQQDLDYGNNEQVEFNYGYDDINRLTTITPELAEESDTKLSELEYYQAMTEYTYDGVGNRLTETQGSDLKIYDYEHQELEQITKGVRADTVMYEYDASGNIIQKIDQTETFQYHYNNQGRLSKITQTTREEGGEQGDINALITIILAEYRYDENNQRISKTIYQDEQSQTIYFLYDSNGLLAEYDEAGALIRQYDYYSDYWSTSPMYQYSKPRNPDGTESEQYSYSFYQNDHLGTPQLLIEQNGAVSWQAAYEAFGAIQQLPQSATASTKDNPLRFPGQYQDIETDTYYNYHRDYAPDLGRYVQSDPIGLTGGLNTWIYVRQNPLAFFDQLGLRECHTLPYESTTERYLEVDRWIESRYIDVDISTSWEFDINDGFELWIHAQFDLVTIEAMQFVDVFKTVEKMAVYCSRPIYSDCGQYLGDETYYVTDVDNRISFSRNPLEETKVTNELRQVLFILSWRLITHGTRDLF